MTLDNLTLQRLVKLSLERKTPPKIFVSLYNQLHQRQPVPDSEYIGNILIIEQDEFNKIQSNLKLDYSLQISLSNDLNFERFWQLLNKIDIGDQIYYLIKLNFILISEKLSPEKYGLLQNSLIPQFEKYVCSLIDSISNSPSSTQKSLINHAILFLGSVCEKLPKVIDSDTFKPFLMKLVPKLNELYQTGLLKYLILKTSKFLDTNELNQITNSTLPLSSASTASISSGSYLSNPINNKSSTTSQLVKSISTLNPNFKKTIEFNNLKKYLIFDNIISTWKFNNLKQFPETYEALFSSTLSPNKNSNHGYSLAFDIIRSVFTSFSYSLYINNLKSYVKFNWQNFIVTSLPVILSSIKFPSSSAGSTISKDSTVKQSFLDDAITDAFESLGEEVTMSVSSVKWNEGNADLRKEFAKSCLFNQLLSLKTYHKLFPDEISRYDETTLNNDIQKIVNMKSIEEEFNVRLLEANIEFTSLEESGLLEYLNTLTKLIKHLHNRQLELSEVVNKIVDNLIQEKSADKLNRLILSFLNNIELSNIVFFHEPNNKGPWNLLNKLIKFIDSESFNAEDDDTYQETYSYFGVLLLGIIFICESFNVKLSNLSISNSYIIDYINNFYYRLCDNLTNVSDSTAEEDMTIVTNYNNLVNEWINALFDDSNDGLSDELIKSINVKQIYKLIPNIYQQAIVATECGKIDENILNNGVDYLSQLFLVPCTVNILRWLVSKIELETHGGDCDENSTLVKILFEILKSNLGEDALSNESTNDANDIGTDQGLIFKLVLKISGEQIIKTLKKFKNWNSVSLINKIIKSIQSRVDCNYNDDLDDTGHLALNDFNLLDQLKANLVSLLNEENSRGQIYQFVRDALTLMDKNELVRFLINEIEMYQRSNVSEDLKILINFFSLVITLDSVEDSEDKLYWIERLKSQEVQQFSDIAGATSSEEEDQQFSSSMDYHFSIIFNDLTSGDSEGDDDAMDEDEDDLFNENIEKISKKVETTVYEKVKRVKRYDSYLQEFTKLYQFHRDYNESIDEPVFNKALNVVKNKLLYDLDQSSWV